MKLDRAGIFKAYPLSWRIFKADSGAVSISIELQVTAQLNAESEWDDWGQYDVTCFGQWWVVKKTGQINQSAVDQLAGCLAWGGQLSEVTRANPPMTTVQIKVEEDTYNEQTSYRAVWMNPEDFVPTGGGASDADVQQMDAQFGSLLRAAATSVTAGNGATTEAPAPVDAPPAQAPPTAQTPPAHTDDDIPF